ncbi:MAG TPA: PAS domain S-box protein, partial [Paraburkholderia sp.]
MTPFLSKRLLINVAVVVAAVGANAFVAYTQICGQRDAAERMLRSTSVRQHIDGYHLALDGALAALGHFEASGEPVPVNAAAAMATSLAGLDRELHQELAGEPPMLDALARLSADSHALQHDIDDALLKSAATTSAVSATATEPDASRAWAASTYTRLGLELDRVEDALAALRSEENHALLRALAASASETQRAMFLLIVTMLTGSVLLIFTFGARESSAREKLRTVRALGRNDERFRGLFDDHPVPMYIFDRETLRFLAVNAAAIQQYGYTEDELLGMTIRGIRSHAEIARLESYLQRAGAVPHGRTMAGIWHHRRKDGSIISVDVSYHALNFVGRAALFVLADDVTDQINAEAEAQRSNQMLEAVIDNIPQRIFWKDLSSRYLGCNMAFARDAGLAYPEQVVGKSDVDLPWRAFAELLNDHDKEVVSTGVPK